MCPQVCRAPAVHLLRPRIRAPAHQVVHVVLIQPAFVFQLLLRLGRLDDRVPTRSRLVEIDHVLDPFTVGGRERSQLPDHRACRFGVRNHAVVQTGLGLRSAGRDRVFVERCADEHVVVRLVGERHDFPRPRIPLFDGHGHVLQLDLAIGCHDAIDHPFETVVITMLGVIAPRRDPGVVGGTTQVQLERVFESGIWTVLVVLAVRRGRELPQHWDDLHVEIAILRDQEVALAKIR
eukprot:1344214-Pleurochrysis_carterae.AAC.1